MAGRSDPTAGPLVRGASRDDAPGILEIYAPIVTGSAISFEVQVPSLEDMRERIETALVAHSFLVAQEGDLVAGYAYGGPHRARAAYRFSVEVSVYVHEKARGRGLARSLYSRLLDELASRGYCNAYAGVTEPNPASIGFHRAMGFAPIGTFPRAGWKFGRWHDVAWLHRKLLDVPAD